MNTNERIITKDAEGRTIVRMASREIEHFANFVSVPDFRNGCAAEEAYRRMWNDALKLCTAAGADPQRIDMIVKLLRVETDVKTAAGIHKKDPMGMPEMTIAWRLQLSKDEVSRVPQEIFDEINHGDFIRG